MFTRNRTNIVLTLAAVAFAVIATASPSFAAVHLPFSEDFDSGSAPDFTFVDPGEWSISGGELNNSASGNGNLMTATVEVTGDVFRMSTTFSATTWDGNSDIGFGGFGDTAAFSLFADDYYLGDLKDDGSMRILERDGAFTTFASAPAGTFSFSAAETYELIFEFSPDGGGGLDMDLTIIDPSEASPITISGNDPTPLTGDYFGYRNRIDTGLGGSGVLNATFDNFALNVVTAAVPEPGTLTLLSAGLLGLLFCGRRRKR